MDRSLRGRVAVIGVGETEYYKRGGSPDPEFKLALKAIITACENAGICLLYTSDAADDKQ